MLITNKFTELINDVRNLQKSEFEIKDLGVVKRILGIEIIFGNYGRIILTESLLEKCI